MDLGNGLGATQNTLNAEIQSFFDLAPPLKGSGDVSEKLEEFIKRNSIASGKFTLNLNKLYAYYIQLSNLALLFYTIYFLYKKVN